MKIRVLSIFIFIITISIFHAYIVFATMYPEDAIFAQPPYKKCFDCPVESPCTYDVAVDSCNTMTCLSYCIVDENGEHWYRKDCQAIRKDCIDRKTKEER